MKKIFLRLAVILFWVGIISFVLYFPKWRWSTFDRNQINVFAWGDILEPSVIADFEKETGIKVRLNYYSSNEELLVKIKATKGEGYDLIIPSDYAVNALREEGLLQELKREELPFWNKINPLLLNHTYDIENRYSIPFSWEIFLLGINRSYFPRLPDPSWKLVFDKESIHYRIAMVNDPRDALQMGSFYLFGLYQNLSKNQLDRVQNLLIEQKEWVEAYASFRADYFLATKNCPVVVASSSYIIRAMRKYPFVGYLIPKEGTFLTIENFAIPKASKKEALTYKLIRYLFQEESVQKHYETFGFFPSALPTDTELLIPVGKEEFKKFHFIGQVCTEQQRDHIWVEVKSGYSK